MATKPRPNETGSPLLLEQEACNHLRIRQRQLYSWRMQGVIPFIRIGRSVRYRLSDLEAAIDALTVVCPPPGGGRGGGAAPIGNSNQEETDDKH